jgi:phosphoenolpyruvate carboxylase
MYGDQIDYAVHGINKPTDRRTCKMIKSEICKYLLVDIGGLSLEEEPATTIIHKAFVRAVDQLEEYGYLTLNSLEHIVRDEHLKAVKPIRTDKFNTFYDKYNYLWKETHDKVEEAVNAFNERTMDEFMTDYKDIWNH